VNALVHAPASGRLSTLQFPSHLPGCHALYVDRDAQVGDVVEGPDRVFGSVLAEVAVVGKDLRHARSLMAAALATPPVVAADAG
jgi:hypothetical protein